MGSHSSSSLCLSFPSAIYAIGIRRYMIVHMCGNISICAHCYCPIVDTMRTPPNHSGSLVETLWHAWLIGISRCGESRYGRRLQRLGCHALQQEELNRQEHPIMHSSRYKTPFRYVLGLNECHIISVAIFGWSFAPIEACGNECLENSGGVQFTTPRNDRIDCWLYLRDTIQARCVAL